MVTLIVTVPWPGGLVTVICVLESAVMVARAPPNLTLVALASPVPVMARVVPPAVLPLAGDTPVTAGSAAECDRVRALARNAPEAATTIAVPAAMAALAVPACQSRVRRLLARSGVRATVVPWTAGAAPDGHRAASSSAASPRCDRPRSRQSGP